MFIDEISTLSLVWLIIFKENHKLFSVQEFKIAVPVKNSDMLKDVLDYWNSIHNSMIHSSLMRGAQRREEHFMLLPA